MLGQINQWFFNDLVCIGVDAEGAGFRKSIIKTEIVSGIELVKGFYQIVSGLISSGWKREDNRLNPDISITVNTSAIVYILGKKKSMFEEVERSHQPFME